MTSSSYSLSTLAERFGLSVHGNGETRISGMATLANAQTHQLGFLANPRYRRELETTHAGALILRSEDLPHWNGDALIARDPYSAFARIAALFEITEQTPAGIHPSAFVSDDASVDPSASIGPHVTIGPRSRIEAGARIGPGCVIGEDCIVGSHCELIARVTLVCRVKLSSNVRIHPGAVLGADGFGLAMHEGRWIKVPQLGGVRIGKDCEIGANTTIDRGALEDTVLEEDVRLDNQIQVGHNVIIGAHTAIAGCVAIAGSAKIGRYCLIGGAAGIAGHIDIADKVVIQAMSLVASSITESGTYGSSIPARDARTWKRMLARLSRLDKKPKASNTPD